MLIIFLGSDFYGGIANDVNIPSEDIQKYILATSGFAKGMQNDINHYVTRERINNASFKQKLDPIGKNISRRQNPLELVFEDISTFNAENPMIGSLLRELDVKKRFLIITSISTFFPPLSSCTVHTASTSTISTATISFWFVSTKLRE